MNVFLKQIKIYKNMINYKLSWYSLAYSGIPWHIQVFPGIFRYSLA
jgi:hypothetical protein